MECLATVTDADAPAPSRRPAVLASLPGAAVVAVTLVVAAFVGRRLWFFSDDWNIYAQWPSGRLLEPFNSHLSLVPIGIYQALFHTVGVGSYLPYRLVGLVAYGVLGWVVWRYGRERVGPVGGAIATAAVLWNSGGVTNVMFPFLLNFSLPVAALAAVWWNLDRADAEPSDGEPSDGGRQGVRHEVVASLWLCLALATSGLGLIVAVAVGVELLWRRPRWRRWAILAPGPALWLLWYAGYGVDAPEAGGLRAVASYAVRMLLGGFGSFVGGERYLAVGVVIAYGALVVSAMYRDRFDGRVAAALSAAAAFAVLTAVSRIGVVPAIPPDELRYQWTIGAFLVLAAIPMVGPLPRRPPAPLYALAGALVIGLVVNGGLLVDSMREWARTVEAAAPGIRANLWVAEHAGAAGRLDRSRQLPVSYVRVTAGEYVDAAEQLGSPIAGAAPAEFGGSDDSRRAADEAFVADAGIVIFGQLTPPPSCDAPTAIGSLEVRPGARARSVSVAATSAVTVSVGLFGHGVVIGEVPAGHWATVPLPPLGDGPVDSYRVTTSAPAELQVCPG